MKSINIHGNDYIMVNERVKFFRECEKYQGWALTSEIVSLDNDSCVFKAIITDEKGIVKATGFAQEDRTSTKINQTSFVENCETSAWGRALGNLGIGIDKSIASAEEVLIAIGKQENLAQEEIVGGDYILKSGKYKEKTIKELIKIDIDYLNWCLMNSSNENLKKNIQKAFLENNLEDK